MRILQLIDTLNKGGAERMAVNYANSLIEFGISSFLVTTRGKGEFVLELNESVNYFYLNRNSTLDVSAIKRLLKFIKKNNIDIVHAHGTSWFIAFLCRLRCSSFKLIWHNHYGNSPHISSIKIKLLSICSKNFDGIISVNPELLEWSQYKMKSNKNIYLPNFVKSNHVDRNVNDEFFNIACFANLRREKDHLLLLEALDILKSEIKLHGFFIGRDFNDKYSIYIKKEFKKRKSYITYYDNITDPFSILNKMNLGILVSRYEGMPMSVLEYGEASLPVISTNVGACEMLLENKGILISPGNLNELVEAIRIYAYNPDRSQRDSKKFHHFIKSNYSSQAIIPKYLEFCRSLC